MTAEGYTIDRRLDLRGGDVERDVSLALELSTWLDPAWHHAGSGLLPRVEVVGLRVEDVNGNELERSSNWDLPPYDEQGHRHSSTYAVPASPAGDEQAVGLGRVDGWVLLARPAEVATATLGDPDGEGATTDAGPFTVSLEREGDTRAVLTVEANEALTATLEAVDWSTAVRYRTAQADGSPGAYLHVWAHLQSTEPGKVALSVDLPRQGRNGGGDGRGTFELSVPVRYWPHLVPLSLVADGRDGE